MPAPCRPVTAAVAVAALHAEVSAHTLQYNCGVLTHALAVRPPCRIVLVSCFLVSCLIQSIRHGRFGLSSPLLIPDMFSTPPHVPSLASAALVAHLDRARQAEN